MNWRVDRHAVKVGDVYDHLDDRRIVAAHGFVTDMPIRRRCRVVKVVHDNTDEHLEAYVEVVIRHPDGAADRKLCGVAVDYYLYQVCACGRAS